MSDLTFSQGSDPVSIFNDTSGNQLAVNSDGTITTQNTKDTSGSGSVTTANSQVVATTNGCSTVRFQITGTWAGQINFEGSIDGSVYNVTIQGKFDTTNAIQSNVNVNGTLIVPCGGLQLIRARFAIATSGTANIAWDASVGSSFLEIFNTTPQQLLTRSESVLSTKQLYSATVNNLTPPATPTDMVTITGSSTKTIRVLAIELFPSQTLSGTNTFFIIKRSAADSGGTSTSPTIVPHDSGNAAATAVVRQYTVNPSLGAAVGTLYTAKVTTPAAGALVQDGYIFDFVKMAIDSGIVLRGTTEVLALNFNGAALPGGLNINANVIFLEE